VSILGKPPIWIYLPSTQSPDAIFHSCIMCSTTLSIKARSTRSLIGCFVAFQICELLQINPTTMSSPNVVSSSRKRRSLQAQVCKPRDIRQRNWTIESQLALVITSEPGRQSKALKKLSKEAIQPSPVRSTLHGEQKASHVLNSQAIRYETKTPLSPTEGYDSTRNPKGLSWPQLSHQNLRRMVFWRIQGRLPPGKI
jgi:hypothetical protein